MLGLLRWLPMVRGPRRKRVAPIEAELPPAEAAEQASCRVVISSMAGETLADGQHAVGSGALEILVASNLPSYASLVVADSVADEMPLTPGGLVYATLVVPDRSIRVMLFYRTCGMPFYAVPEMSFELQLGMRDTKAPLRLALQHWGENKEFKGEAGLVGYVSQACRFLNKIRVVGRRDLLTCLRRDRHVDVFMHTDSWEPYVAFCAGGREVVAAGLARPDQELLRRSPRLDA